MKYNKIISHHEIKPEHIQGETPNDSNLTLTKKNRRAAKKRANLHLEHEPSDEMDLLISSVNEADLGWKADVCKYQKHHALYGDHCDKPAQGETVTLAQVSDEDDSAPSDELLDKGKKEFGVDGDKDFETALSKA